MRRLLYLAVLILVGGSRAAINPLTDISGGSATVALEATGTDVAKWIALLAPPGNSNNVRFGDSTTTATKGGLLVPGATFTTPACDTCVYPLSGTYVYVATGDKLTVTWGN